ncbi:ATP-binding cassette domain-containing protein [Paenibacillus yanchengensis]|uniref:ATP-binding cassette domain-containing protein n=1 Tax=Paenibacillus yanchengensis TaxID=2035833 RepID=A0ABW4YPU0_9BACL
MNQQQLPAIQLQHIYYNYQQTSILSDFCLTIEQGEWVAIAGSNGSGKSTFARLINGLLQADRGEIYLFGEKLTEASVYDLRKHIGYIFASPDDQFVGLTVADDIAFGLENLCLSHAEMSARIQYYAQLFDITSLLDRHPGTLSGGQKQRVAIAAVLAMEPKIIIMDEALSMLDAAFKQSFMQYLATEARKKGQTLLTISHDLAELAAADRLILLHDGQIIADGAPQQLLQQQQLLTTCRLLPEYTTELSRELQKLGIPIELCRTEKEVLAALWALHSKTFPSDLTKKEQMPL